MTTTTIKRNFYIPDSYVLKSGYAKPAIIIPIIPLISSSNHVAGFRSYYQQNKFFLPSTVSSLLSPVGIHKIDDDHSSLLLDKV